MFTMWLVAIGTTTLIEAVYWGHTKVVRLLIRKGASVNVETPSGRVPLLEACNRTNMHVAKVSAALTSPRAPARLTNACCHSSCFKLLYHNFCGDTSNHILHILDAPFVFFM